MTKKYFPFDDGAGRDALSGDWDLLLRRALASGVLRGRLNALEVFGDSTGMQVKVKSGEAMIDGRFFRSDAQETLAVTAANATNPRIDYVVAQLDRANNIIDFAIVAGTPAASPAVPALTQNETGIWQLPLARVAVGAAVSTITAGNVTDVRMYAGRQSKHVAGVAGDTTTSTGQVQIADMITTLWTRGGDIDVELSGEFYMNPAGGNLVRAYVAVDGAVKAIGTHEPSSANFPTTIAGKARFTGIAAGLHTITGVWNVNAGTAQVAQWRYLTATEVLD